MRRKVYAYRIVIEPDTGKSHIVIGKVTFKIGNGTTCSKIEFELAITNIFVPDSTFIPLAVSGAPAFKWIASLFSSLDSNLKIIGEYFLEVNHCLLAPIGATLEDIKRVHSHEQAIAQCRKQLIK